MHLFLPQLRDLLPPSQEEGCSHHDPRLIRVRWVRDQPDAGADLQCVPVHGVHVYLSGNGDIGLVFCRTLSYCLQVSFNCLLVDFRTCTYYLLTKRRLHRRYYKCHGSNTDKISTGLGWIMMMIIKPTFSTIVTN